jgi:membrane-bound metal-dependent hydrolase YbcI (DUF457 family)
VNDVTVYLPVTPFHYPLAYIAHKLGKNLSLPGLVVGSMLPDLEIPVMLLLFGPEVPNRMVLHSLLGAATVGTLVATAITAWIYPSVTSRVFLINKREVKQRCTLTASLVLSCLIGVLSHVLLDVTNHDYNPVFWPFLTLNETASPITPLFGGALPASIVIHSFMALLFAAFFLQKRENFWEHVLVGK